MWRRTGTTKPDVERRWVLGWAPLLIGLQQACAGATTTEAQPINMERELDILMECAGATLEAAGYTLASNSADTRRLSTDWREAGDERHRAYVTVLLHPSYGPGVSARLEQQASRVLENTTTEGEASEAGPTDLSASNAEGSAEVGWQVVPSTPESTRWQERYLSEVQECWRERREVRTSGEPDRERANLSGSEESNVTTLHD